MESANSYIALTVGSGEVGWFRDSLKNGRINEDLIRVLWP